MAHAVLSKTKENVCIHKKAVQYPEDKLGAQIWPRFHCLGAQIWPRDVVTSKLRIEERAETYNSLFIRVNPIF